METEEATARDATGAKHEQSDGGIDMTQALTDHLSGKKKLSESDLKEEVRKTLEFEKQKKREWDEKYPQFRKKQSRPASPSATAPK
ncbi:hypothetical protein ACFLQU_04150 [Verrucomicrobiota bacterium]